MTHEPTDPRARRRLRNYLFLDKKVQFRFAGVLAGSGAFFAVFFTLLFYFYFKDAFLRAAEQNWPAEFALPSRHTVFFSTVILLSILYCLVMALIGLLYSHRIVGPLVNISHALRTLSRGDIPPQVKLRQADLLTPFASSINEMLESLRKQRVVLATDLMALRAQLGENIPDAARAKLDEMLDAMTPTIPGEPSGEAPGEASGDS